MLATLVIETVGTQEYELRRGHFMDRFTKAYGHEAAAEVQRAPGLTVPRRPAVRRAVARRTDSHGGAAASGPPARSPTYSWPRISHQAGMSSRAASSSDEHRHRPADRHLADHLGQLDDRDRAPLAERVDDQAATVGAAAGLRGAGRAAGPAVRRAQLAPRTAAPPAPGQHLQEPLHVRRGRARRQRDPHVALGQHAHRPQHMARRQRAATCTTIRTRPRSPPGPARAAAPLRRRRDRRR